jgi:heme exporter protein B
MAGTGAEANLSLLGAFLLVSFLVAPWIASASMRVSLE